MTTEPKRFWENWSDFFQLLALVGGAGTFLSAACFAIGYVALNAEAAMLGITSMATPEMSVRAGALFLPRAVQGIADYVRPAEWLLLTLPIFILIGCAVVQRKAAKVEVLQDPLLQAVCVFGLAVALVLFGMVMLQSYTGAVNPINRLLLSEPLLADSAINATGEAGQVYGALHKEGGDGLLSRHFGKACVIIIVLVYGSYILKRTHKAVQATASKDPAAGLWLFGVKWICGPVLVLLVLSYLVALPAVYGVLGLPHDFPCFSPVVHGDTTPVARLITDISSDQKEVALIRWRRQTGDYLIEFIRRDSLQGVRGEACGRRNLLAYKVVVNADSTQAR